MASFIEIPVTSEDNLVFAVDSIVTCLRTAATTTDIIIKGGIGQTANLNIQLTHAADTVTASVAKSIMDGVIEALTRKPDVSFEITVAKAVSAVAVA